MTDDDRHPSRSTIAKIRKLADLEQEVRDSRFGVAITRLTVLKSLCKDPAIAIRFVTYLAQKTWERITQEKSRTKTPLHRDLMSDSLEALIAFQKKPGGKTRTRLETLRTRMRSEQDTYKKVKWTWVRLVTDSDLLLFEYAVCGAICPAHEAGTWAYQTARHFTERYDPHCGHGLAPASIPFIQDIVSFWVNELNLTEDSLREAKKPRRKKSTMTSAKKPAFTHRQGQFLAFIHLYWKLHRRGPAETDLVQFFRLTPPSVHDMIVRLEALGLVTRETGVPRSVRVAIPDAEIPSLESI